MRFSLHFRCNEIRRFHGLVQGPGHLEIGERSTVILGATEQAKADEGGRITLDVGRPTCFELGKQYTVTFEEEEQP